MKEVNLKTKIIKNIHTSIHTQPYTTLKQRKRNFTKMCLIFLLIFCNKYWLTIQTAAEHRFLLKLILL